MIGMRIVRQALAVAALVAGTISCGDVIRQGRSPVYLVINSLQAAQGNHVSQMGNGLSSDVLTLVSTPAPCTDTNPCPTVFNDVGQVTLRMSLKDIGGTSAVATAPTTNNEVTITRYHVSYRRADGRNTQGVDVPYAFDGAATGTVPATGTLTLGFILVRNTAKEESPLVQLISSPNLISAVAEIIFYGHDQVGNQVNVAGSIDVTFANFGD
jgi:hypothetical protein